MVVYSNDCVSIKKVQNRSEILKKLQKLINSIYSAFGQGTCYNIDSPTPS